jgi:hypothetical protein
VGGDNADLLVGGNGVDALFGRGGDDWLFSDLDGNGVSFPLPGEVLDGGANITAVPGDSAAQSGLDFVSRVETLADGGAVKDVVTWLMARIVSSSVLTLQQACTALFNAGCSVCSGGSVQGVSAVSSSHNAEFAYDVNQDKDITPLDALLIINDLNAKGARATDGSGEDPLPTSRYKTDTNNDGYIAPIDVLLVINYLNGREAAINTLGEGEAAAGEAEGEGPSTAEPFRLGSDRVVVGMLAGDEHRLPRVLSGEIERPNGSPAVARDGSDADSGIAAPETRIATEPQGQSDRGAIEQDDGQDSAWLDLLAEDIARLAV